MNYLLDTHVMLWAMNEPEKLSKKVKSIIEEPTNSIYVSSIAYWELSLKASIGKLNLGKYTVLDIYNEAKKIDFKILNLNAEFTSTFYQLSSTIHRDPFDRMLIWQAIQIDIILITKDTEIKKYSTEGLKTLW